MGRIIRGVDLKRYFPVSTGYGNDQRLMEVSTVNGNFMIPDRAITYPELNAKVETGIDVRIDGGVAIYEFASLDKEKIEKLIKREEYFKTGKRNARAAHGKMDSFPLRLISYPVTFTDKTRENENGKRVTLPHTSGIDFLEANETNLKNFIIALADFTRASEFELLTIPQFSRDPEQIKRIYEWILTERNSFGFEDVIPTLSLRLYPGSVIEIIDFIESLDKVERKINIFGFQSYSGLDIATQAFEISRRLARSNFISIVFGIERGLIEYDDLSGIHTQAHIFGEAFALKKNRRIQSKSEEKKKKETPPWQTLKFLDTNVPKLDGVFTGMTQNRFDEILNDLRDLLGDEAEREIKVIMEFKRRFSIKAPKELSEDDEVIVERVRYISKLHEYLVSQREFAKLRENLRNGTQKEYVDSKPLLFNILSGKV